MKFRLSIRTLLILVGLLAIYLGLLARTGNHANSHSKEFSTGKTIQLESWPEGKLKSLNGFQVLDETTLKDKLLLRSQLKYEYRITLVDIPQRDRANYKCETAFTIGPFSSTMTSHKQNMLYDILYE